MYTLTVWTADGRPHRFAAATRSLTLRALRQWMNGGDYGSGTLAVHDCTGTNDVTLSWNDDLGKWSVYEGGSSWNVDARQERRLLRTPADWQATVSHCTDRRYFTEWSEAREAFVDTCAYRVADLDARCRCAHPGCGKELVRAHTPWIPNVGWICFDDLIWYVGEPERAPSIVAGETCETEFSLSDAEAERLLDLGYGIEG